MECIVIDYYMIADTEAQQLAWMIADMYAWARWFPDAFIILSGAD